MKTLYRFALGLSVLLGANSAYAQNTQSAFPLGGTASFLQDLRNQTAPAAHQKRSKPVFQARVSGTESLDLNVNFMDSSQPDHQYLVGEVNGVASSNFHIRVNGNHLEGNIILKKEKKAYRYSSDKDGNAWIEPVDIDKVLCIDYEHAASPATGTSSTPAGISAAVSNLQSFPGARACVLLDYDGQYVSGTPWNGGNPIDAAPSGMSDAQIQESWELVSEDYRPFNINITTNEAVFNSYPKNMRMRCIFTPTNTAAPGAGGVAYVGSFNWNDDTPCWDFILDGKNGGEAASHEIGHTLGLSHDGRITPSEGYYAGQGNWAPIMGVGYYKPITQWSRGEYTSANNQEDDLSIMSGSTYNVGFRNDEFGNSTGSAYGIGSGNVNISGIITTTSDVDFFVFNSGSGTISLNINTVSRHGDLDILAKLYNSSGAVIGTYNNADLNATISIGVSQGTYYLSVDGTGAGNPATDGYSDYASLGSFTVTGTIPAPVVVTGVATFYKDCNFSGSAVGLDPGDYTLAQLNARGIANDDISSIKVNSGYEVQIYQNDNFSGTSFLYRTNDDCMVDNGVNDFASSVRIRAAEIVNLSGAYYLQNRNSGLNMDVSGNSTADGANIQQWTPNTCGCQQFQFTHLGNGIYKILVSHSGKSMEVAGAGIANGVNVQQWTYGGGDHQQFIVKSTGDGYYRLYDKFSSKLIEVAGFSTTAGGNVQQWDEVSQTSGQWKLVPVTPVVSTLIQAENYSAMAGVQTEATSDAGGGLNVGWIDTGDWMAYNSISFPTSGSYLVEYRVASVSGGKLSLDLNAGSIQLGALNVPATGGWQNWTTISHVVNVNAGTYNVGLYAQTGGWNINWIRITKQGAASATALADASSTSLESTFEYFPNPAEGRLFVRSSYDLTGGQAKVFDSMGEEIFSATLDDESLNVSTLKSGIYTLLVIKDGNKVSRRFVKL